MSQEISLAYWHYWGKKSLSESVTNLFPANNVGENTKSHHAKHHGNEVNGLGVQASKVVRN